MVKKKEKIPKWVLILVGVLICVICLIGVFITTYDEHTPSSKQQSDISSKQEVNPLIVDLCESKKTLCESQQRLDQYESRNCDDEYEYCLIK